MLKQLGETLKAARKVEVLILIATLCTMLVLWTGESNSQNDSEEARMARILSKIEGAGKVCVMLTRDADGASAKGALVTATGASSPRVRLELQRAVQTLTGLELAQIEVLKSDE